MKHIERLAIWLCILTFFVAGFTDTLNISTPAGSDDPREADDRMREIKAAFVQRLDADHYFYPSATSTYDGVDTGKHRFVTFREPNDLTSMAADESALFSKDVSAVTELHWIDESDQVLQITNQGLLNINSSDLLGTLANDTYFNGINQAGNGTVELIKATTSNTAEVPNGIAQPTSAAPTADAQLANKKYVDDNSGSANWTPTAYAGEESITFPNGFIMKLGSEAVNALTTETITFSSAFPNAIVSASATYGSLENVSGPEVPSRQVSSIDVRNNSSNGATIVWQAWGY